MMALNAKTENATLNVKPRCDDGSERRIRKCDKDGSESQNWKYDEDGSERRHWEVIMMALNAERK